MLLFICLFICLFVCFLAEKLRMNKWKYCNHTFKIGETWHKWFRWRDLPLKMLEIKWLNWLWNSSKLFFVILRIKIHAIMKRKMGVFLCFRIIFIDCLEIPINYLFRARVGGFVKSITNQSSWGNDLTQNLFVLLAGLRMRKFYPLTQDSKTSLPAKKKGCPRCYKTRSCLDLKKQKERKEEKKKNGS